MPDLFALSRRQRQRIAAIERLLALARAHARRGERRAASARLGQLEGERSALGRELESPLEYAAIAFQIGLIAAPGPLVRGRLMGALVAGALGWCAGLAVSRKPIRRLEAIGHNARALARTLLPA